MDRVKNWDLTKKVWDVIVHNNGASYTDPRDYIENSYKQGINDSSIFPAFLENSDSKINSGDGIIFFNFRNDRMKQLVAPFAIEDFKDFDRSIVIEGLEITTMTKYSEDFLVNVAYPPEDIKNTLGEVISKSGLKQLRLAESEKEAHVTNFFDGGKLDLYKGEERIIENSKILVGDEYAQHPELELEKIVRNILVSNAKPYSLVVANFANTDVLAHTGDMQTAQRGLELVDKSLEKIINLSDIYSTVVIITADHGNIEEMLDPQTGKPDTQHSTASVPIVFVNKVLKMDNNTKNL